jgi:hypothetical protein
MKTALIVISSILAIVNILPYIRDVYRKKNKPRIVSWLTWSLLTGIASAASFSDRQYASGILLLLSSLETLSVVILGWRFGVREFDFFDAACQAAAVVGLVLWLIFNSPSIAIIATISIDIAASLPTLRHAWRKPFEETAITFFLGSLAALFTFMAAKNFKITAVAFPIYLVLMNFLISAVIYTRQHNLKPA